MAEVQELATYVQHHQKEIAFLFSAMRHFAEELRGLGWCVADRQLSEKRVCEFKLRECAALFVGE